MFNILKIFKKKPKAETIPYKVQPQNEVNEMKDELPLVNEGLLTQPLKMVVIYADEMSGIFPGDIFELNSVSLECNIDGAKVDSWMPEREVVKIIKGGFVIKGKKV